MAREQTTTSGKQKRKEEKKPSCETKALYRIFDNDGLDKEFFALLQSQAPEDQKLREYSVDLVDMMEREEATGSPVRKPSSYPLPRGRRQNKKRVAPSSNPKKSTTTTTSTGDKHKKKREDQSRSKRGSTYSGSLTDDSDSDGNLTALYGSTPPSSPPHASPYFTAPLSSDNESSTTESPCPRDRQRQINSRPTTGNTAATDLTSTSNGINHETFFQTIMPVLNGQPLATPVRNTIGTEIYNCAKNKGLDKNAAEFASTFLSELLGNSVNGMGSCGGTGSEASGEADLDNRSEPSNFREESFIGKETTPIQNDKKRKPVDNSLEAHTQKRAKDSSNKKPSNGNAPPGHDPQHQSPWSIGVKGFSNGVEHGHDLRLRKSPPNHTFGRAGPFSRTPRRQDQFRNGYVRSPNTEYGEGNLLFRPLSAPYRRNERVETFDTDGDMIGFRQRDAYQTASPTNPDKLLNPVSQLPFSRLADRQLRPEPTAQQSPPKPVVQELSPPESSRKSLENEPGFKNSGLRPLTCLPTEPVQLRTPDQWDSPKSMHSPAPRKEPLRSQEEVFAQVRAMSEVTPSKPRLSTLGRRTPTGERCSRDIRPASSGHSLNDCAQDSSSRSELSSRYFTNKTSNSGISSSLSNPAEKRLGTDPLPRLTPPNIQHAPLESPGGQTAPQGSTIEHIHTLFTAASVPTLPNESVDRRLSPTNRIQRRVAKPRSRGKVIKNISKYFPLSKAAAGSCLPFPGTRRKFFGLVQETLAQDPFQLLVATIFLNRTKGHVAIPILKKVLQMYPTVESLAIADVNELGTIIRPLGLQRQRASKIINLANTWLSEPPAKGQRYRKLGYPKKQDGRDVKPNECLDDADPRSAWEIAHLPGIGPYAIDSWRIFCRDELRGLAPDYKGSGTTEGFVPEWKTVLPTDKELRAYLTWMWLKEGYSWDMETGEVNPADPALKDAVSKNKAYITEDGLELSLEPRSAVVEDLRSPTPPPGLKEEISPLDLPEFETES